MFLSEKRHAAIKETLLVHTRYSSGNVFLLIAALGVNAFVTFLLILTAGFAADPVHDRRSFAMTSLISVGLLNLPSCLLAFRWIGLASTATWCVAFAGTFFALVGGLPSHVFGLILLLVIEALICSAIKARSHQQRTR